MLRVSVSRKHIGKVPEQSLSNNQWHSNGKLSLYHFQRVLWKSKPKFKIWHRSSHISLYFFHWSHHSPVMGGTPDVKGGPPLFRLSPILPIAPELRIHRAQASDATIRRNQPYLRRPSTMVRVSPQKKNTTWKDTTKVTFSNNAIIMWTSKVWQMSAAQWLQWLDPYPIVSTFDGGFLLIFFPSGTSPPRFHLLNLIPVFDE